MDIAREPPPKRKKYLPAGIAVAAIVLTTFGLSRLKPAAPTVDRATVWMDTVEQGLMLIQVSGPGNLEVQGRVERKLVQPGTPVTASTILVELSNPDVQLQLLESQRQLSVAQQQLVTLGSSLETQSLNQEGLIAQVRSQFLEARRNAGDLEELARKGEGYVSDSELQGARERAEEFETRLDLETRRLQVLRDSEQPQSAGWDRWGVAGDGFGGGAVGDERSDVGSGGGTGAVEGGTQDPADAGDECGIGSGGVCRHAN